MSAPALAVLRATESGCGVLFTGRSWVLREGWVLEEGGSGGFQMRYFVVSGDRLEYFKEEKVKLEAAEYAGLGIEFDRTNVVIGAGAAAAPHKGLCEGDVVIGVNGEPVLSRRVRDAVGTKRPGETLVFTVLRPKGHVALHGASVAPTGPRKHNGGHMLTVSDVKVNDASTRRSKCTLVCADERTCAGWVSSIKEAIAAASMEDIKTGLSQALLMQALQQQPSLPLPQPPHGAAGGSALGAQPTRVVRSNSADAGLSSFAEGSARTSDGGESSTDRRFEV